MVEADRQGVQTWTHPTEREQAEHEQAARSITVGEWLEKWGDKFIKETTTGAPTSAGTQRTRVIYLAHLHRAQFIDKPLRMLTAADVERWLADFDAGATPRRRCFQTLKKALTDAVAQGYIDKSPIESRPAPALPKSRQAEIPPLTPSELATIAAHMPAGYAATIWLGACCGLRINEVSALQAADFDLPHRLLHVRHSLDAATRELKAPKTEASEATLPLPDELVPMLQELGAAHPTGPVFPAPHGGFLRHQTLRSWFDKAKQYANRPDAHFHTLRATFITALTLEGATVAETMSLGRHADVETSVERYQRALQGRKTAIMDRVGHALVPHKRTRAQVTQELSEARARVKQLEAELAKMPCE